MAGRPPGDRPGGDPSDGDPSGGSDEEVAVRIGKLRELSFRELAVRFVFGAGVSLLAGAVSTVWGPRVGGVFLAFPAILLASLTMVAEEEGIRRARDEARGAALGTLGLIAFALVAVWSLARWPTPAALATATAFWAAVSGAAYLILRVLGAGADEH